jgi:hypothetical protein
MDRTLRLRVILHGGIVMLVGLLCGLPAVNEGDSERYWHTAHEALILIGVLLFAVSSVMPYLVLGKGEAKTLFRALLATGYGLMGGTVLQGVTGQHAFGPSTSPVVMVAFLSNVIGILGSVLTASLTIMGAAAALKASPKD